MSYPMPTYAALVNMIKSVCPPGDSIWHIDEVRILNPIMWESRGVWNPERKDRFYYNYLFDVDYIVKLHYAIRNGWNSKDMQKRRRKIERALGRYGDAYLGSCECPAVIEVFDEEEATAVKGYYDDAPDHDMGLMFHSYYQGENGWVAGYWRPRMVKGVVTMQEWDKCKVKQPVRMKETLYATALFDKKDGVIEHELAFKP